MLHSARTRGGRRTECKPASSHPAANVLHLESIFQSCRLRPQNEHDREVSAALAAYLSRSGRVLPVSGLPMLFAGVRVSDERAPRVVAAAPCPVECGCCKMAAERAELTPLAASPTPPSCLRTPDETARCWMPFISGVSRATPACFMGPPIPGSGRDVTLRNRAGNPGEKRENSLLEDIARYKKDKQSLEVDLLQMKKERDLLRGQLANISDDKSYEIKIMEETYKKDIARLNKRLQWFAENQDILDKDAGRLKDAYEQIENLKTQVEKLRHDAGYQSVQQQNRVKDRAADANRIQDLERQVKEMEAIIKRRHPNSIPALMFAAAAVSETDEPSKSSTVAYLERRIQKLERDIEGKDEDAKKTLRSMEQNFQKVKFLLWGKLEP
ncbi:unnamed protein product [Ranitomeya imitator]|uniref:Centrosomal protein of 162 kDa n=1 Tax=Ranitomeya imitator TaxID=111125 RepID=A0ABN9M127_9NEOB|nr:unnamed protein product [Ranitomeya imitator]